MWLVQDDWQIQFEAREERRRNTFSHSGTNQVNLYTNCWISEQHTFKVLLQGALHFRDNISYNFNEQFTTPSPPTCKSPVNQQSHEEYLPFHCSLCQLPQQKVWTVPGDQKGGQKTVWQKCTNQVTLYTDWSMCKQHTHLKGVAAE